MNVYGMIPNDNAASYYRVQLPLNALAHRYAGQHSITVGGLSRALDGYDVVVVHGFADAMTDRILTEYQSIGGKVIFDLDDWLLGVPASWPCYDAWFARGQGQPKLRLTVLEGLLQTADVVTCPTPRLAEKIAGWIDAPPGKVQVMPNMILMGDWDIVPEAEHSIDGPVVGWFGASNHWDDWAEIAAPLMYALEHIDGRLAVLGAPEVIELFSPLLAERTWVNPLMPMSQFDQVRRLVRTFDIGLAWCTHRLEASRCRSPLKVLQYGAAGVPVIASQTVYGDLQGWNSKTVVHAHKYGVTVGKPDGLIEAIKHVVEHPADAQRRAQQWQQVVWNQHSLEMQAGLWLGFLKGVCDRAGED